MTAPSTLRFAALMLALIVWTPVAAPGAEIVGVSAEAIALEASEGALVRLDAPAKFAPGVSVRCYERTDAEFYLDPLTDHDPENPRRDR